MKSAIVTGGANGIGRVIVNQLASEGWHVGILDLNVADVEREEKLPKNCVAISADVSEVNSVEKAIKQFGSTPDLLVNNAGIVRFGPLLTIAQSEFEAVVRVNLIGTFTVSRQVAALMIAVPVNPYLQPSSWRSQYPLLLQSRPQQGFRPLG